MFVASPQDVAPERLRLAQVIDELNSTPLDARLQLVGWETHAWPGMGQDAQDVINRQIQPTDVFVGIMWRRFGTPTGRAESGTEEEFERAYQQWREYGTPHILFYFKNGGGSVTSSEEAAQTSKVNEFRAKLNKKGLTWGFDTEEEFTKVARLHLTKQVRELLEPQPTKFSAAIARVRSLWSDVVFRRAAVAVLLLLLGSLAIFGSRKLRLGQSGSVVSTSALGNLPSLVSIPVQGAVVAWLVAPSSELKGGAADPHYSHLFRPNDHTGFKAPSGSYFVFHNYGDKPAALKATVTVAAEKIAVAERSDQATRVDVTALGNSKYGIVIDALPPGGEVVVAIGSVVLYRDGTPPPPRHRIDEVLSEGQPARAFDILEELGRASKQTLSTLDELKRSRAWLETRILLAFLADREEAAPLLCELASSPATDDYVRLLAARAIVGRAKIGWEGCFERAHERLKGDLALALVRGLDRGPWEEVARLWPRLLRKASRIKQTDLLDELMRQQRVKGACGDIFIPLVDDWRSGRLTPLESSMDARQGPGTYRSFLVSTLQCTAVTSDPGRRAFLEERLCLACTHKDAFCRSSFESLQKARGAAQFAEYLWGCRESQPIERRRGLLASLPPTTDLRWLTEARDALGSGNPEDARAAFAATESLPQAAARSLLLTSYNEAWLESPDVFANYVGALLKVDATLPKATVLAYWRDPRAREGRISRLSRPPLSALEHYEIWKRHEDTYPIYQSLKTRLEQAPGEVDGLVRRIRDGNDKGAIVGLQENKAALGALPDERWCQFVREVFERVESDVERVALRAFLAGNTNRACIVDAWVALSRQLPPEARPEMTSIASTAFAGSSGASEATQRQLVEYLESLTRSPDPEIAQRSLRTLCDKGWSNVELHRFFEKRTVGNMREAETAWECFSAAQPRPAEVHARRLLPEILAVGDERTCNAAARHTASTCLVWAKPSLVNALKRSDSCAEAATAALTRLEFCDKRSL